MCEIIGGENAGCEHDYAKRPPPAVNIPPPPTKQPATSAPAAYSCISSVLSDY